MQGPAGPKRNSEAIRPQILDQLDYETLRQKRVKRH
jgi:hypothetical protein